MHMFYSDMLAKSVARHGGKVALVHEGSYVSFRELDTLADAIGHGLRHDGVGLGDIVPITLERGIAPVAAAIGAWRAGAAAALLDPANPKRRRDRMIAECSAKVVLDHDWLQTHRVTDDPPLAAPETIPTPDDTALVAFTSGQNGYPKGVAISHRTLARAVRVHAFGRSERDVFLASSVLATIPFELEVLTPLALGGTVHLTPGQGDPPAETIAAYVRRYGITATVMDPGLASRFLDIADGELRFLLVPMERNHDIFSVLTEVCSSYGCVETCGPVTRFDIDMPYDSVPLGRPLPGARIHVVDDRFCPVAAGETGEICVSGQIASGYLNNPALTARRFVPNPLARDLDEAVLFRTGDQARVGRDGVIEYIGRRDRLVRVGGRRVEPGEVEVAMLETSPLDGAVVAGIVGEDGLTRLHGWYTAGAPVAPAVIVQGLAEAVPGYMVPAVLKQVPAFPRTANGRIDMETLKGMA
ncbi:MAG: AMP-binding protein [Planctomycetes bacterium]|nr:AMP-binding protein [Planctomycetota bacterium]